MKLPWKWLAGLALLGFNGWALTILQVPVLSRWLSPDNARNLAVLLAALAQVLPALWLSRKMKRKRVWFSRYLVLFNLLLAGALVYYAAHTPPPAVSTPTPSPTPGLSHTPKPRHTPRPVVVDSSSPLPLDTPSPVVQVTPTPEVENTPAPVAASDPDQKYAAIDRHALETPPAMEKDVKTLARYLVGPARNDEEKIRAIYRWVADRIAYDTVSFFADNIHHQEGAETLRTRIAVCDGYATLVDELAKEAGLKSEIVEGFASCLAADPDEGDNHAWNAIKLAGGWRLLDSTWGAGTVGEDHKFHKEFNGFFFLPTPEQMLVTHFPADKNWQLILPPISKQEFLRRPKRMPDYFTLGLKVDQLVGEIAADPRATLDFRAPSGLYLMAQLKSERGQEMEGSTLVDRDDGRIVVNVLPPAAGKYFLEIYAFQSDSEHGKHVLEYTVMARSGDPNGYPHIYNEFQQHSGHVFRPAGGRLKPGLQHFELELSGASQVFVDDWDNQLQKEGDRFVGDVAVEPGDAKIFAVFSGERGQGIISYQVR